VYLTERGVLRHFEAGKKDPSVHRKGLVRVHAAGARIGQESGQMRLRHAVAEQAGTVATHGGEGGQAVPTLHAADDFVCKLCDGSSWEPPAPQPGFASSARLPTRTKSAAQLEFILFAAQGLKDHGHEAMHGHEASEAMLLVGTHEMQQRWPSVPYAAATSDGLPRLPRTARLEPAELTPILKLTRAEIEKKLKRLRDKEESVGAEEDDDEEEDEEPWAVSCHGGGDEGRAGGRCSMGDEAYLARSMRHSGRVWAPRRRRRFGAPWTPARRRCRGAREELPPTRGALGVPLGMADHALWHPVACCAPQGPRRGEMGRSAVAFTMK